MGRGQCGWARDGVTEIRAGNRIRAGNKSEESWGIEVGEGVGERAQAVRGGAMCMHEII